MKRYTVTGIYRDVPSECSTFRVEVEADGVLSAMREAKDQLHEQGHPHVVVHDVQLPGVPVEA